MPTRTRSSGQASVELVCLLPLLAVVALAAVQIALYGHAAWAAASAARAAARAEAVGAAAADAARSALPGHLERGLRVRRVGADGGVEVRLRVPVLLTPLSPVTVAARSHFEAQG